jgi:hypothetical protein
VRTAADAEVESARQDAARAAAQAAAAAQAVAKLAAQIEEDRVAAAAETRRHHIERVKQRALRRLKFRAITSAFERWQELLRRARLLERFVRQWRDRLASVAFRRWHGGVTEAAEARRLAAAEAAAAAATAAQAAAAGLAEDAAARHKQELKRLRRAVLPLVEAGLVEGRFAEGGGVEGAGGTLRSNPVVETVVTEFGSLEQLIELGRQQAAAGQAAPPLGERSPEVPRPGAAGRARARRAHAAAAVATDGFPHDRTGDQQLMALAADGRQPERSRREEASGRVDAMEAMEARMAGLEAQLLSQAAAAAGFPELGSAPPDPPAQVPLAQGDSAILHCR